MHPIDEFAEPFLWLVAGAIAVALLGSTLWRRYRSRVEEGTAFWEDEPEPLWTAEQLVAWREYFADQRPDPAIDLR